MADAARFETLTICTKPFQPTRQPLLRTRPQEGRAVGAGALVSQGSEPSSSDDDGGLSDSDPDSSSDDDGCSSEHEQGRSSTSKHSRWSDLDEQRLLAYSTRKRASLGSGSLASSQAGLGLQYARAGTWSSAEASRLPPAGGQAAAQALCAYLPLGICWDECLKRTLSLSFCYKATRIRDQTHGRNPLGDNSLI
jgi:hypothetical protein